MGRRLESQVLAGWKSISSFLSVSVKTARRLARQRGLPIHHCPRPMALIDELKEWIRNQ